jgi:glutaredoxin
MTYYIKVVILKDCPFSKNALKLLEKYKIPLKIINVDSNNKELYKFKDINTFPQIYLKRKNKKGHLLLGGYTELNNFINDINSNNKIDDLIIKYKWSKIAIIKFMDLIQRT